MDARRAIRPFGGTGRAIVQALLPVVGWLALTGGAAAEEPPAFAEYQIKAAFLYNFAKFVEWPAQKFAQADTPIVIGVFGTSPLGPELEKVVRERQVNGRKLVVRTVETAAAAVGVHLLFVPALEDRLLDEFLPAPAEAGVLTVGESSAAAKAEGIIVFVLEGDKVRFEINMDSAERAGLKISAQLQKLARAVHRSP